MSNVYSELSIFPCYVLSKDSNLVNPSLIETSKNILRTNQDEPFYSSCISTVNTKSDILEMKEFLEIRKFLFDLVHVYCQQMKINSSKLNISTSWLNLYNENGYQDLHNHQDSLISGVFWIQSSEEKDFVFQAPWHFMQPVFPKYTETTLNNCHNVEMNSVIGRGMVFMSHMLHRTLPTKSERISLSFNVR
jgi:uncharacterized protein (TIGR02466 family)